MEDAPSLPRALTQLSLFAVQHAHLVLVIAGARHGIGRNGGLNLRHFLRRSFTSSAPSTSSSCVRVRAPITGTIAPPFASTHARANCAGVIPLPAAIS